MDYELVTHINPQNDIWEITKKNLLKNNGSVLAILPSLDFTKLKNSEQVDGINIFDYLTKRKYDSDKFLFFNKARVPNFSEIFMNKDFSISIIHEGEEIGEIELYPNTRRLVKSVKYYHSNKDKDFTQEYTIDGKLFSEIFYFDNKPQEIHFYNDKAIPIISYYFYQSKIIYITLNDEKTGNVKYKFDSLESFLSYQIADIVTKKDSVTISYLGIELSALSKSKSYNILRLTESPLDSKGEVKGNLLQILEGKINYIHEVRMSLEAKKVLHDLGIDTKKVVVSDE